MIRNKAILFFICTLLFSWLIWFSLAITQVNVKQPPWFYIMMIGGLSPSLFGLIFITKTKTYTKKEFMTSTLSFHQIGIKNILCILMVLFIPFIGSVMIDYFIFGNSLNYDIFFYTFSSPKNICLFVLTFIYAGPLSEEFGWRGFATKSLLSKYNLLKTGIIIGIIWSLWHYPLFFLNGQYTIDSYPVFIINRLLKEVSLAIIITFFFKKTNNSILCAMLIHSLSNIFVNLFLPVRMTRNIAHTCILIIITVSLVLIEKKITLRSTLEGKYNDI
ncbi:MAG: CPBP family intramembrane metalloprotease [Ignavibacteriales bacterium]|nr:CPBP family intramembrane metalloprotease [Ignavibacteriales bacterium]